mmetsp:Transcript_2699/g.8676  ORF Transcript_2699/g.8676 Transcript_2699/m.8676 type:complete len:222 (+) Transcript_2699:419-1084(+)
MASLRSCGTRRRQRGRRTLPPPSSRRTRQTSCLRKARLRMPSPCSRRPSRCAVTTRRPPRLPSTRTWLTATCSCTSRSFRLSSVRPAWSSTQTTSRPSFAVRRRTSPLRSPAAPSTTTSACVCSTRRRRWLRRVRLASATPSRTPAATSAKVQQYVRWVCPASAPTTHPCEDRAAQLTPRTVSARETCYPCTRRNPSVPPAEWPTAACAGAWRTRTSADAA